MIFADFVGEIVDFADAGVDYDYSIPVDTQAVIVFLASTGNSTFPFENKITLGRRWLLDRVANASLSLPSSRVDAWVLTSIDGPVPAGETETIRMHMGDISDTRILGVMALSSDQWIEYVTSDVLTGGGADGQITLATGAGPVLTVAAAHFPNFSSITSVTPITGFTRAGSVDVGTEVTDFIYQTVEDAVGGNITIGWTHASSSKAMAALAFREVAIGTVTPHRIPEPLASSDESNFLLLPDGWVPGQFAIVCAKGTVALTTPPGWTELSVSSLSCIVAYRQLQEGDTDAGTWIGADAISVSIYNLDPDAPFGDVQTLTSVSSLNTIPDLTLQHPSQSHVLVISASNSVGSSTPSFQRGTDLIGFSFPSSQYITSQIGLMHTPTPPADFTGRVLSQNTGSGTSRRNLTSIELNIVEGSFGDFGPWQFEMVSGEIPPGFEFQLSGADNSPFLVKVGPSIDGIYVFEYIVSNDNISIGPTECTVRIRTGEIESFNRPNSIWSLDFGRLRTENRAIWFKDTRRMSRPAIVNGADIIMVDTAAAVTGQVVQVDKDNPATSAYYTSPNLNRPDLTESITLNRVVIKYEAGIFEELIVQASNDGGVSWVDPTNQGAVNITDGSIGQVSFYFNVTGIDVRFRISFSDTQFERFHAAVAFILRRGSLFDVSHLSGT